MTDIRVGSTTSPYVQSAYEDALAPVPAASPQGSTESDGWQYRSADYGIASPGQTYLPDNDDSTLAIDIRRIIEEANQERSDATKERALTASTKLQDMMAKYDAAMERFRESLNLAQLATSVDASAGDVYVDEATTAAAEAFVLAEEMGGLADECGASAEMIARMAQELGNQAEAAISAAQSLAEDDADTASADKPLRVEDVVTGQSPVERSMALVARLTSPGFAPINQAAAQLTATALTQIAAAYDDSTATRLAPALGYWTSIAEQQLASAAATPTAVTAAPADTVATSQPLQSSPFWGIGTTGATGQETVSGQAATAAQYLADQALVFVTRTVDEVHYTEGNDSSYASTVQVERQFPVPIGEATRELSLDAAGAAAYLERNGVYLLANGAIGTRAELEAASGRAATEADRAFLVRAESVAESESGSYVIPAVYDAAPQRLQAVGHDLGVYEWLPADVIAAAQASTGGNVLLASSDQTTTVQAHLDEQSLVFTEQLVNEYVMDNNGEGGSRLVAVARQVPVPTFQAAALLGLSVTDVAAYAEANRAFVLSDGSVGTRAAFEAAERRAPSDVDRAYIVRSPTLQSNGESGDINTPAQLAGQTAYLEAIGLSSSTSRALTISFNDSRAHSGDVALDTSHRTIDLTQPNATLSRAYQALANDALAGQFVQIGDKGPINDDVAKMLGDVYARFGADTPDKQEIVRSQLFRYDPSYGVLANRDLVAGAVELNNNRRQGFFERSVGRALVTVVASVVGGPVLAAGVSAAFAAYDGGSLGNIVTAGATAYAAGVVGANVGGAVTSSLASSGVPAIAAAGAGGVAQGVSSSAASQLITTGRIDGDALLASGIAGGVGVTATTALGSADFAADMDRSLGVAPGTTAGLIGSQAGSLAAGGGLNWQGALLALGNGALTGAKMEDVRTFAETLRADPSNEVTELEDYRTGNQKIEVRREGRLAVQYSFQAGELVAITPAQRSATNFYVEDAVTRFKVDRAIVEPWGAAAMTGQSLIARGIPASVVDMARLATVAIHTRDAGEGGFDAGSGVLAVAAIGGVDRAVLVTSAHVVEPGPLSTLMVRDNRGEPVEIPFDNQTAFSTGVVAEGRVTMNGANAASTDGYLVTLSPETLEALRPGVSLASLPRVGTPSANGTAVYQFGFAQWGNVGRDGEVRGFNLVGAAGTAAGAANGTLVTTTAMSATNPPVTAGMSGGPLFQQLADGTIEFIGNASTVHPYPTRPAGTEYASHFAVFTAADWLVTLLNART